MEDADRPVTATRYRGDTAAYVPAWECVAIHNRDGDHCGIGYVYAEIIARRATANGHDMQPVAIIRHDDGTRELLSGFTARTVFLEREPYTIEVGEALAVAYRMGWRAAVAANE